VPVARDRARSFGEWIASLHLILIQPREPGALVRREHAEGRAASGQELAAFVDHLILERAERAARGGEAASDLLVATDRAGFVVVIGEDRVGAAFGGEHGYQLCGIAVPYEEARAASAQRGVEFRERAVDEGDATVVAVVERIENHRVEDEDGNDRCRCGARFGEHRVVVEPQIAAKPRK
jgi:hypothetical protein